MDIGEPQRTYTVEPVENPVPEKQPERVEEPAKPEPVPSAPVKAPAGA